MTLVTTLGGQRPPFTWQGFAAGLRGSSVIMPTVIFYGLAFGVLASNAGLSELESLLFSALVNAGGAQMASLQAWGEPVPVLAVVLTTAAMNARYLLLGAALRPWWRGLPGWQTYGSLFVLGDGNWALALRERSAGRDDAAFLVGVGAVAWVGWASSTLAGHLLGGLLGDPARFGLDFMLGAFFAALAVGFFRSRASALPLVVGIGVAILVERLVPGPWYILAGATAGAIAGGLAHGAKA